MIDVWSVAANGLWVVGLSILLAALSWTAWAATAGGDRLRIVIVRSPIRLCIDVGFLLFCSGLAATARTWWERLLWGGLTAAWGVQIWISRRETSTGEGEENA
jgi:hypothetical protein